MKQKLTNLTPYFGLYDFWKNESKNLSKKEETLILCDFDDTIFSRKDQLEASEILRNNRGLEGVKFIINDIGIEKYINNFVANKSYPKDIINTLDTEKDLILTAGIYETQMEKLRACGLQNYKVKVVEKAEEKIIATIRYVLFELKYLPKTIILYEDRPEYFLEYRDLLEDILECKLIINKVQMNGNENEIEITQI